MTVALMFLGVFLVPTLLLIVGHRVRRRAPRWRRMFWGAIAGYVVAMVVGTAAGIFPPEAWGPADFWRGLLGLGTFLLAPAVGAVIGMATATRRSQAA